MTPFFTYTLSGILFVVLLSLITGAIFGLTWGLFSLCVLLILLICYNLWKLHQLNHWLKKQDTGHSFPQSGRAWEQIFSKLKVLEKNAVITQNNLKEALVRFQKAGEALPNGVIVLDNDDRIQWCNPTAEKHFGIQLSQDLQQALPYLIRHSAFLQWLKQGIPNHPILIKGIRGTHIALSLQMVPYSNQERLLVSHDVSQVERDEKIRQDFVANVSHELRTPITVIGGFIETLIDNEQLEKATRDHIYQTIYQQTTRMQHLVEELLSLSSLESQQFPAPKTPVSIALIMNQLEEMAKQISKNKHRINTHIDDTSATILGSENELISAFGNLVANAVRYTPDGGTIDISWYQTNNKGCFQVKDTGIGIAKEHLSRLTERFYRIDKARSRDTGGTGLGLSIVKQIALHHEAQLDIESQPGEGSVFKLIFPSERVVQENNNA